MYVHVHAAGQRLYTLLHCQETWQLYIGVYVCACTYMYVHIMNVYGSPAYVCEAFYMYRHDIYVILQTVHTCTLALTMKKV